MQNLKELLERLLKNNIDFVLVGGFASVLHGSTLVTQDLDICVAMADEEIDKLRQALKDLNPIHRMNPNAKISFMEQPKDLSNIKNIYLKTNLGILDIMSELPPVGNFEVIKKNAIEINLYNYKCKVISLEDLIKIKESMTRPKDRETLNHLKQIQKMKK
ncbi:MAG: nucleotidyltransferase [Bdellovibrionota bacterium]